MEAALTVRGDENGGRIADVRSLFQRYGDQHVQEMSFEAEMIVPSEGEDDLGKKAEATRLLFKQVELGQIPAPRSYEECEEKVAALLDKDLSVIEEAVKLASAGSFNDIGTLEPPTLATSSGGIQSHRNAFEQAIMQGS